MIKYTGCSRWGMMLAAVRARSEHRSWYVLGFTGYIGDAAEFRRWKSVPRLELRPDGGIVVHKAGVESPAND